MEPIPSEQVDVVPTEPPRAVGPRAKRRSWGEPAVRLWWLSAVAVALIGAWVAGVNFVETRADQELINEGHKVEALLVEAEGKRHVMIIRPGEEWNVVLTFTLPGETEKREVRGKLTGIEQPVTVTKTMTIFVDRNDPRKWTARQRVDWQRALFVPVIVAGSGVPLMLVALAMRASVLRTWKDGRAMRALAVEVKQSAAAPMSRLVRYTLADEKDARVYAAAVPVNVGVPEVGGAFWVVKGQGRALAAKAYADPHPDGAAVVMKDDARMR